MLLITPSGQRLALRLLCQRMGLQPIRDGMVAIARILLLCPALHYVDDCGSMEPEHHATSGFQSFEQLNGALRYHMKKSKRQPPDLQHKIQGVIISTDDQDITLTPCPQRVKRMQTTCETCRRRSDAVFNLINGSQNKLAAWQASATS